VELGSISMFFNPSINKIFCENYKKEVIGIIYFEDVDIPGRVKDLPVVTNDLNNCNWISSEDWNKEHLLYPIEKGTFICQI